MGVLRWQSRLDEQIARASSQPLRKVDVEVFIALRLGTYQLLWLDRIPKHAAINESVELVKQARKRSAAGFVNAVLRKLSAGNRDSGTAPTHDPANLASRLAHPEWLVRRWIAEFGVEGATHICEYDQHPPTTTIRLRDPNLQEELANAGVGLSPGALLSSARRVESGDITRTAAFRERRVAIQDEGSQLVAALVGTGSRILDCCCAPGGKTAILAESNPHSPVVAVELHPHRARLTRKLVPHGNVQVISADSRALPLSGSFDRVLVDVPCSGTGTLARNPEIKWRLKPGDLAELQSRQVAIVTSAMDRLSPGGRIVYSSCSLEKEENQDVIDRALKERSGFRLIDVREELLKLRRGGELVWDDLDSLVDGPYLRTLPGVHPCDGFFAAIITTD